MAVANGNFPDKNDRRYISAAMDAPMLEREYEVALARRWRDEEDADALHEIIEAHIRLVVRIASKFKGYGLPIGDLIQEGNRGLLEAANRFDPDRNVRYSTYATWWILAAMQEYIVRNSSIVRIGTTPAQKSLFFNLRKLRAKLTDNLAARMTEEERELIASELRVPLAAVERMESHFSRPDQSLNATVGESDSNEFVDLLSDDSPTPEAIVGDLIDSETRAKWIADAMEHLTQREREVITRRFLKDDKITLAEIGETFGVTKERIRQIEGKALSKLRESPPGQGHRWDHAELISRNRQNKKSGATSAAFFDPGYRLAESRVCRRRLTGAIAQIFGPKPLERHKRRVYRFQFLRQRAIRKLCRMALMQARNKVTDLQPFIRNANAYRAAVMW